MSLKCLNSIENTRKRRYFGTKQSFKFLGSTVHIVPLAFSLSIGSSGTNEKSLAPWRSALHARRGYNFGILTYRLLNIADLCFLIKQEKQAAMLRNLAISVTVIRTNDQRIYCARGELKLLASTGFCFATVSAYFTSCSSCFQMPFLIF